MLPLPTSFQVVPRPSGIPLVIFLPVFSSPSYPFRSLASMPHPMRYVTDVPSPSPSDDDSFVDVPVCHYCGHGSTRPTYKKEISFYKCNNTGCGRYFCMRMICYKRLQKLYIDTVPSSWKRTLTPSTIPLPHHWHCPHCRVDVTCDGFPCTGKRKALSQEPPVRREYRRKVKLEPVEEEKTLDPQVKAEL